VTTDVKPISWLTTLASAALLDAFADVLPPGRVPVESDDPGSVPTAD